MAKIWLVRHGETDANVRQVFQGQLDTDLNESGIAQARELSQSVCDITFGAVYASDLQRSFATARHVIGDKCAIAMEPDLREIHYGVLQGVEYSRFNAVLRDHGFDGEWGPGVFAQNPYLAPPGGESLNQLHKRLVRFVERMNRRHPLESSDDILIVAHGGSLRTLITILLDLPHAARDRFSFRNCAMSLVVRDAQRTTLEFHNVIHR